MVIYHTAATAVAYSATPIQQEDAADKDEDALQMAAFFCHRASVIAKIAALNCHWDYSQNCNPHRGRKPGSKTKIRHKIDIKNIFRRWTTNFSVASTE
jgi:hypothetical protein